MKALAARLDPNVNPSLHRNDCGYWGPCDCDAHKMGAARKLLRLLFGRLTLWH